MADSTVTGGSTVAATAASLSPIGVASSVPTLASGLPYSPTGAVNATAPTNAAAGSDFRITLSYLSGYQPTNTPSTTTTAPQANSPSTSTTGGQQYPGILAPLSGTGGLRFPYAPTITNSQDVDYSSMTMVHSNTDYHAYNHTPNVQIGITGKFTVQSYQEGIYALACIHFLRSVSRMYFGETDTNAGVPPPILQLNGYGTYMYNKVRCYVKSHSWSFDEGMDTVNIQMTNGYYVRLPALFTLQVNLVVQNTARAQRLDFTLENFRSGQLMETTPNSSGWI